MGKICREWWRKVKIEKSRGMAEILRLWQRIVKILRLWQRVVKILRLWRTAEGSYLRSNSEIDESLMIQAC
jgi:hypothetical protein